MDMGFKQTATAAFHREDQEEEGSSNRLLQPLSLLPPPSSSSSTSSSPTRWTADEPPGGSGPPPPSQIEKEPMFDKVVTPSDVGKLNRLVIPKQHAERYFPLDASTNEKGLLLNFEDRDGKPWRFRYSYWNSSQSYVMTKGWSRFVKEKRLDAGDTVSFARSVGDAAKDRLFIDWKRRPEPAIEHRPRLPLPPYSPMMCFGRSNVVQWGHLFATNAHVPSPPPVSVYEQHRRTAAYAYNAYNPYLYLRSASSVGGPLHVGVQFSSTRNMGPSQSLTDTMPVDGHSKDSPPKRVRLFGVDLHESSTISDSDSPDQVRQRPLPSLRLSIGSPGDTNASGKQP